MTTRVDRSGFILLMVLAVLIIASTLLAATVRRSSRNVMEAGTALQDLQLRWGVISLHRLCMASPASRLISPESGAALARTARTIRLGKLPFRVILADEQAKANVNMLLARSSGSDVAAILTGLNNRLRPVVTAQPANDSPARFAQSWDQVFEYGHPSELIDPTLAQSSPSDMITCWGNGLVNFKTATTEVLQASLSGILSEAEVDKLRALATDRRDCRMEDALGLLQLDAPGAAKMRSVLTDRSECLSLWVVAQGKGRSWYRLYVQAEGSQGQQAQVWAFEW